MILAMAKVRLMGPRSRLADVLAWLQRVGIVHLSQPPPQAGLEPVAWTRSQRRAIDAARRAADEIDSAVVDLARLGVGSPPPGGDLPRPTLPASVILARRARRAATALVERRQRLVEERELLARFRRLVAAFEPLADLEGAAAYLVVLPRGDRRTLAALERRLREVVADEFHLESRRLDGDETGLLLIAPRARAARIDALLSEVRAEPVAVPASLGAATLLDALPRLEGRRTAIERAIAEVEGEAARLGRERGAALASARQVLHDTVLALQAQALAGVTERAFVLEGWLPAAEAKGLGADLQRAVGPEVVLQVMSREEWRGEQAPVVLRNPRLFRPFEAVVRLMPLPRYGTIDPTPYVAVFFPMFFGLAVGDIGHGVALAALALLIRARSRPGSSWRSIGEIAGACAVFSIAFGVVFGELFGDLGRRFGLRPLGFDRSEALVAFLLVVVALGAVHLLLGLGLGVASALRREPRKAASRGVQAVVLLLVIVAILAAVHVLPGALFTPSVIAILAAFPVLVLLEGIAAPIELLSTLGRVLSYARVMAIGTASVLLAATANRMAGWVGSALVGALFALLFHLVNFAITLLSPTIHVLRLHYVEFFGTFYSPGGMPYRPFTRWTSTAPGPG